MYTISVEFTQFWVFKFSTNPAIRTSNAHNFESTQFCTFNISTEFIFIIIIFKSKKYVHITYPISRWNYTIMDIQIFCKSGQSIHLMFTISCWIYAILYIQRIHRVLFLCKSKQSVRIMYTISHWIYTILDIQFFYKSKQSVHLIYTISLGFMKFCTFNVSIEFNMPCSK